jgi:alkanesulfonate monooxygenase SsuD/methylene tetrahydromethanopterin reductase-like flavin-dependent oxidoreductase (luciferase family)
MEQVGVAPRSPLALLEETITSVRALLHGERVTSQGREVRIDDVRLVHPPAEPPPLVAGVVRPRSLELSGRVADGTLIAEGHGPRDLENIRALLAKGGAGEDHTLSVFAFCAVGDDPEAVARTLHPHTEGHGAWLGRPQEEVFTVSGSAAQAAGAIGALRASGADTVVLRFVGPEPLRQLEAVLEAAER